MNRRLWNTLNIVLAGAAGLVATAPFQSSRADPPVTPPACAKLDEDLFCWRVTFIEGVPGDPEGDRFRIMMEFVNWTGSDAYRIRMARNIGGDVGSMQLVGADVDFNGRPFADPPQPPTGNIQMCNTWFVNSFTDSLVIWETGGPPIPPCPPPNGLLNNAFFVGNHGGAPGFEFNGLLDPAFDDGITTGDECRTALNGMIPGSNLEQVDMGGMMVWKVNINDTETADNGSNVLDGFWIELDDWDVGDSISFNWWLEDEQGNSIGMVFMGGSVMGDQFGFGALNLTRLNSPAPAPLFNLNGGFDPSDTIIGGDADDATFWAENEVNGIDTYPINPIPAGRPGAGRWFAIELGAAVTAQLVNPANGCLLFNGQPVQTGTNLTRRGDNCRRLGDVNLDGQVDLGDISVMIFDWGPVERGAIVIPTQCGAIPSVSTATCDLDGDFDVGVGDLAILIHNWRRICIIDVTPVDRAQ